MWRVVCVVLVWRFGFHHLVVAFSGVGDSNDKTGFIKTSSQIIVVSML